MPIYKGYWFVWMVDNKSISSYDVRYHQIINFTPIKIFNIEPRQCELIEMRNKRPS